MVDRDMKALAFRALLLLLACVPAATPRRSAAGEFDDPSSFMPRVPVSAFARPAAWLDPSRLHVSSTVSVGSGFGGGANALQVTSLSYQLASPLSMRLSLGNAWGPATLRGGSSMFLEGFDMAYRPSANFMLRIQYQDVRSPLQLSNNPYGYWGR